VDIPLFADFFLDKTNKELNKNIEGYEDDVQEMFLHYSWPGNLREFRNVVRRAVLLTPSGKITSKVLPWEITNTYSHNHTHQGKSENNGTTENAVPKDLDLKDAAAKAEYDTIMNVLKDVNFNKTKAAEILKIDRKTLYNKIKIYQSL
jgi:two-component system, NtrC family, response regulator HydG